MVRDAHDAVADDGQRCAAHAAPARRRTARRSDAPAEPAGVVAFRRVWSDWNAAHQRSFRAWAGRVSGRSDRRLLLALAGATEAIATHCDLLAAALPRRRP